MDEHGGCGTPPRLCRETLGVRGRMRCLARSMAHHWRSFKPVSYCQGYRKWRKDIRTEIPLPDFSSFQKDVLDPWTDTTFLIFFITRRCNLNCSFCYLDLSDYKTEFTDRTFDATAESVHRLMTKPLIRRIQGVSLFGGEPLLNRNLEGIVDAFHMYDKVVSITTNGLLLHRNMALLQKLDRISVSVYTNTIDTLCSMLPALSEQKRFVLTFALTKTVLLEEPDVLDRLFQLGRLVHADSVSVFTVAPSSYRENGDVDDSEVIYHDTPAGRRYEEKAAALKKRYPDVQGYFYAPQRKTITKEEKTKCTFAWWYICCDGFGNISPCACAVPPDAKYGNVFRDGFRMTHTFNCRSIREARRYFCTSEEESVPELCRHCIHLYRDVL